ncbi:Synergin gamma [Paragonimus skrjabini miyazakii]|uniref:Synergin gamma n=1 Tax=Paragonimus skrjabini miyazakii TaxID=59628 RepID=A0A8S9Z0N9_9TREM|nr:Synergin gamma [Paragonimus skrjabini miyazakii]
MQLLVLELFYISYHRQFSEISSLLHFHLPPRFLWSLLKGCCFIKGHSKLYRNEKHKKVEDVPDCVIKLATSAQREDLVHSSNQFALRVFADGCSAHVSNDIPRSAWPSEQFANNLTSSDVFSSFSHNVQSAPKWFDQFHLLPPIFHRIIVATTTSYGLDNSLIQQIFLSSGLGLRTLQHIWTVVNRSYAGWLTPSELVLALALIGLAQREELDCHKPEEAVPPIPRVTVPIPTANGHLIPVTSCQPTAHPAVHLPASHNQSILTQLSNHSSCLGEQTPDCAVRFGLPSDEEWADFTSFQTVNLGFADFKPNIVDQNPTSLSLNEPTKSISQICKSPEIPPNLLDDDFGDFQTVVDNSTIACAQQSLVAKANSTFQTFSTNPTDKSVGYIRPPPNYNLSADLESHQSPVEIVRQEWLRCLAQCSLVMQESVRSLAVLSSDADRLEFNECPEGRDFFLDVLEVYRLVQRIASSASEHGILNPSLQYELSGLRELFRSHMPYITLTDIRTSWESASSEPGIPVRPIPLGSSSVQSMEPSAVRCGLCLVTLPTEQPSVMATTTGKVVALAGRSYHMSCANFWINRVQLGLPALTLP